MFIASVLLVESNFLKENIPDQNQSINAILYSRKFPVKHLRNKISREKIKNNFEDLNAVFTEINHHYYEEKLKLQMRIFILEMWHVFSDLYQEHKYSLQSGTLYERFTALLDKYCMQKREVQFYAEKLFITPKYLNHICKKTTGITASQWIQQYTKERLELLLENPEVNISEIADQMDFSSRSFFTRYVKKVIGVTPSEF
ncbi:helix-turn-helix domain-containing protein [Tenacibaculum sp. UWU-22]|uniref:helix-turn-helix domain-containing protein n=1 Tax=Tenacibaculum sp. UWU-22 TaxID=3234187 RepID=UPI0034DB1296